MSELPIDVEIVELNTHEDERGQFAELFRKSWLPTMEAKQVNLVHSKTNVLRGVHVHLKHSDYLLLISGVMTLGLKDLRKKSPTFGKAAILRLDASLMKGVFIPPGIAHGFYFHRPSTHMYMVSHYWDTSDELGCRWDDEGLQLGWPCTNPEISERDHGLGSLAELMQEINMID